MGMNFNGNQQVGQMQSTGIENPLGSGMNNQNILGSLTGLLGGSGLTDGANNNSQFGLPGMIQGNLLNTSSMLKDNLFNSVDSIRQMMGLEPLISENNEQTTTESTTKKKKRKKRSMTNDSTTTDATISDILGA